MTLFAVNIIFVCSFETYAQLMNININEFAQYLI